MTEHTDSDPLGFAAFRASRDRFFDSLAAETLLRRIEDEAARLEATVDGTVTIEGDLVVISSERRLILDYFGADQRDLADVVRDRLGFRDEAFGVGRVGRVVITVERLPGEAAGR